MKTTARWIVFALVAFVALPTVAGLICALAANAVPTFAGHHTLALGLALLLIAIVLMFALGVVRALMGSSSRHRENADAPKEDALAENLASDLRQRLDNIDSLEARMEKLEALVNDLKTQTESLAEDYRFIQRVLEGNSQEATLSSSRVAQ